MAHFTIVLGLFISKKFISGFEPVNLPKYARVHACSVKCDEGDQNWSLPSY